MFVSLGLLNIIFSFIFLFWAYAARAVRELNHELPNTPRDQGGPWNPRYASMATATKPYFFRLKKIRMLYAGLRDRSFFGLKRPGGGIFAFGSKPQRS